MTADCILCGHPVHDDAEPCGFAITDDEYSGILGPLVIGTCECTRELVMKETMRRVLKQHAHALKTLDGM